jgi:hypothetical protein
VPVWVPVCSGADTDVRCHRHTPNQLAADAEKAATRARNDAERGIRRCGALTKSGTCKLIALPDRQSCFHHDPAQAAEVQRRQAERDEAEKNLGLKKRVEQIRQLHASVEQRARLLDAREREIKRREAEFEHKREAAQAAALQEANGVVDALLARAQQLLAQESASPETCDLMIRCAEALTNHSREQRMLARNAGLSSKPSGKAMPYTAPDWTQDA